MSVFLINGIQIEAKSKEEAEDILRNIKKIPSLDGYADKEGNIYKVKYGVIKRIQETRYKDRHKDCYVFDNGRATLNKIMHETFPELDKIIGKIIPNTDDTLSMDASGSIWSVGFKPVMFDSARSMDRGRVSINGYRINNPVVYRKLYGKDSLDSLNDLEKFLNQNGFKTESNDGEQFYAIVGKTRKSSNSSNFVVIKEDGNTLIATPYCNFLQGFPKIPTILHKNQKDFLKILNILNALKNINTQIHTVIKDME